ncbi:MAG: hypothetical protein V1772_05800, partial [Chloroflexota bacterium]
VRRPGDGARGWRQAALFRRAKARIVSLATTQPRDLGLNYTSWTLHRLAEQARARRIVDRISHECVRQILRAADCSHRLSAGPAPVESCGATAAA